MELDEDIIENVKKREIGQIKQKKQKNQQKKNRVKILGIDLGWDYKTFYNSSRSNGKKHKEQKVYI